MLHRFPASSRHLRLAALSLAIGLGGFVPPALAQTAGDAHATIAEAVVACRAIEQSAARLACYDELADPLVKLDDANGEAGEVVTGRGNWSSEMLSMDRPWRIIWSTTGQIFGLDVRTGEGGAAIKTVASHVGEGNGTTDTLPPGPVRIGVHAVGDWRIQVVEE